MHSIWSQKNIMITGVSGSVGQELLKQLVSYGAKSILGIDNNESELFFQEQAYLDQDHIDFLLCDIRDQASLTKAMRGVDIVLHAAALKHVPLCEKAPSSAVGANIVGVQNVIEAAYACGVERVLFTSSDKAVNPTNVMGTSKLMGERLITAANLGRKEGDPIFAVTRFGNVLGTRGSVIPLFKKQIEMGGPVTVTHQDMSRFIMTLEDAVSLVLESALAFKGGEVFITKMPVIRISDLAEVMVRELAPAYGRVAEEVEVQITQPRAGEKMYEELLNEEEVRRSLESDDFFIVKPALIRDEGQYVYENMPVVEAKLPYTSETAEKMSQEDLTAFLHDNQLLGEVEYHEEQIKLKVV